jgi:hypothetical protein
MNIYKFGPYHTAAIRTAITLHLIRKGFSAWEETECLFTNATIEEIDWLTGFKNYFLPA